METTGQTPLLYTRHEAAALLKISVSQLDAEARRGRIRRVKFGEAGRARVMYKAEHLREYIDLHEE